MCMRDLDSLNGTPMASGYRRQTPHETQGGKVMTIRLGGTCEIARCAEIVLGTVLVTSTQRYSKHVVHKSWTGDECESSLRFARASAGFKKGLAKLNTAAFIVYGYTPREEAQRRQEITDPIQRMR